MLILESLANIGKFWYCRLVVIITTAYVCSKSSELRFGTPSISPCGVLGVCGAEIFLQKYQLENQLSQLVL